MASLEQRLQAVEQAINNSRITPNLPNIANLQGDEIVPIWSPGAQDTVQYPLSSISGGSAISNDVIPIFKRIDGVDYSSSTAINQQIANILNNSPSFTKGENQLLIIYAFRILSGESALRQTVTREYYFFTAQKGTYGNLATQVDASDIVYFVTDRDDSRESQIYNLGEIGDTQAIQDAVNSTGPYDPSVAQLIVFRALRNGVIFDYVYIGQQEDLIGVNEEQTIIGDYLNLNDVTPDPPPPSQEIDTELDISSTNAVTNQAITLAIQNIQNQRQSYDEFLYKSFTGNISNYSVTEDFELINNNGTYYLLIKRSLDVDLQNSRFKVNISDNFLDLGLQTISNNNYVGFEINSSIVQELFLNEIYTFTFWRRFASGSILNITEIPNRSYDDLQDLPTLGDLSGLDSVSTADIDAQAVTNSKLSNMNANTVKGRLSGNGTPEDVPLANLPISDDVQDVLDNKVDKRTNETVNKTNDTYTLQASDVDKRLFIPAPCTVIVPNGLVANLEFEGKQLGTGDVEFVAESGGNLNVNLAFQKFTEGEHAYWGIVTLGNDEADLLGTLKLKV